MAIAFLAPCTSGSITHAALVCDHACVLNNYSLAQLCNNVSYKVSYILNDIGMISCGLLVLCVCLDKKSLKNHILHTLHVV